MQKRIEEKAAQSRRESASFRARKRWNAETKAKQNAVSRNGIKRSKQNKTRMQDCNASCNAEKRRIEEKEIKKEKDAQGEHGGSTAK
ncbi:MAG: hypothetical protein IJY53_00175 [Akkermansia sp.]|nr:hypothetical protein [Akkermansia sp.]